MAAKLMHAVQYDSYGGGPSGLKHVQKGLARPVFSRKLPHIPVTDVAGEIVEFGEGITKFKVGDKIVVMLSYGVSGLGEFDSVNENMVVARPPEVSAADGAGLPISALTAKLGNTHVTTSCGARNIELAKRLGADEVLDYKTPEGEAVKSPSGRKHDFVIPSASKAIPWSVFEPNWSSNGKVTDLTPGPSSLFTSVMKKLTFSKMTLVPLIINLKAENQDCLVTLVKEGKLKTVRN
ncbi:hypothetical protein M0R45_010265 [Rubus argutus]|uniref:Alcohol dehydrogenase-like N-terminal domain-containing protein n=1 Tax=Rubus argutus TaxID=59490 RepID=A0AAW1Y6U4_RUBAR